MASASKYSNIPAEEDDERDIDDGVEEQPISSKVAAQPDTYTHIPAEESGDDESGSDDGMRETVSPDVEAGADGEGNNTGTRPPRKGDRDFDRILFLFILILA